MLVRVVVGRKLLKAADAVITLASPMCIALNVISSFTGIVSAWHETLGRQPNTGLGQDSWMHMKLRGRMYRRDEETGVKKGIYCNKCGTKLEDGWACGQNLSSFFWYCPTCDEFVQWQQVLGTGEVSEQGKESIKSFLRYLKHQADGGEPRPRTPDHRKTQTKTES